MGCDSFAAPRVGSSPTDRSRSRDGMVHQMLGTVRTFGLWYFVVSTFLFSKQVARFFGSIVGFIVLILGFLFYRRFLGSLLTENLGLSLGLIGIALLLQSLRMEKYQVILVAYGLFVLTMALLARAGAFL